MFPGYAVDLNASPIGDLGTIDLRPESVLTRSPSE
jgi:hypothetical protein